MCGGAIPASVAQEALPVLQKLLELTAFLWGSLQ